jgi:pantoate--beta-alanine ligase
VATVVAKLLNIVGPSRAYFGQKDYQQCLIIRRLVADLNMPVEIVMCPTVREPGGLAISSRNRYLNEDERRVASKIYQALSLAAERIKSGGSAADAKKKMDDVLQAEPLITEIQYAGVYDPLTLVELSEIKGETLLAAAVKMGGTRLIDNLLV